MERMLEGIRVLDFSRYLPGPYATLRLAEKGADVVLVEPPEGEPARSLNSIAFAVNNRMKRSLMLDLKDANDQATAFELASTADVIVESYRPGVMKRMGLDYAKVQEHNPGIVYCSISGYGQATAQMNTLASHDLNYMALSGMLSQLKDKQGKPVHPSIQIADFLGGLTASEMILSALVNRYRNGEGSYLDVALTDGLYAMLNTNVALAKESGYNKGIKEISGEKVCYHIYETMDGRYIALAALEPKFWHSFCQFAGRSDWIKHQFTRAEEGFSIFEQVSAYFRSKPLEEWTEISLQVDCCLTPVLEVGELEHHPLWKQRVMEIREGGLTQLATMYPVPATSKRSPKKGEHQTEIVETWLQKGVHSTGGDSK
ncbi:Crotonobetainyl-CoA:carnitine CoA-transferase CaiB [Thalassobacillus cyri]|uniref:Crotonobetainyl-CoA:carnitine CoA-transferase CaiB n=1 Tax=Thalassobacillus cyri TaxID=571932 RepID=A0A1H3ZBD9_9BACI|nr:CaiB/BaiF CoA-transferase family protein [Thalassobacillus cyri]SEA21000.1 Crotonobetainyl-CoA:carnitine CoA-transferase CaiB [Thalassobacillus cyri]